MDIKEFKTLEDVVAMFGKRKFTFTGFFKHHFFYKFKKDNIAISISLGGCESDVHGWELDGKETLTRLMYWDAEFQTVTLCIGDEEIEFNKK